MALSRKCALKLISDMNDVELLDFLKDVFGKCMACSKYVFLKKHDTYMICLYKTYDSSEELYMCIDCVNAMKCYLCGRVLTKHDGMYEIDGKDGKELACVSCISLVSCISEL